MHPEVDTRAAFDLRRRTEHLCRTSRDLKMQAALLSDDLKRAACVANQRLEKARHWQERIALRLAIADGRGVSPVAPARTSWLAKDAYRRFPEVS